MAIQSVEQSDVANAIRAYIAENILFVTGDLPFDDDASFLEEGIIDSTGILELQLYAEEAFGIAVEDEDVIPENFDSVNHLADYVRRRQLEAR